MSGARWAIPVLLTICVLFVGLFAWSWTRTTAMAHELTTVQNELLVADSLAQQADDALWYAERLREKSDGILEDLKRTNPELKRRAQEIEAERNVAMMNLVEARKQERGKQVALEGERSARLDEEAQRKIAEGKADSLVRAKRVTDNLNLQQRASVLAQNSTTTKGRPEFRGLMAILALRSMEQSGGDVNKIEVVRALRGALEELERPDPVRVSGFKRPPHQLSGAKGEHQFLALGNDGILYRVNMRNLERSVVMDQSRSLDPSMGRCYLASDNNAMILVDQQGDITAYPITAGAAIKGSGSSGMTGVRALASWPGLSVVVTGDAKGKVQPWRREGDRFKPMEPYAMGAAVKGMLYDPGTDQVVIVAGNGPVLLLSKAGRFKQVQLPTGQNARCITATASGTALIGTDKGAVLRLNVKNEQITLFHKGDGRGVETITASSEHVAFVNAVKELVILDNTPEAASIRMSLDAIPGALVLGSREELYLAFNDRIERLYCSSRSMADRACELIGRTWTTLEWKEIGETGMPENTCAGF